MTGNIASWKRRSGKVAVMTALALPTILIPALAVGVDGGVLMEDKRKLQAGVDAAAAAAAAQLWRDNPKHVQTSKHPPNTSGAVTAALAALDQHGFTATACKTRTVNIPANSDNPRMNKAPGTIEVKVTLKQPRAFSRLWGTDNLYVVARCVSRVRNFQIGNGILILEDLDSKALYGHGSGTLLVNEAGVVVNSSNAEAAYTDGTEIILAGRSFDVTGGYTGTGYYYTPYPAAGVAIPYTGSVPVPDPLAYIPDLKQSDYPVQPKPPPNSAETIYVTPGRYRQRLTFEAGNNIVMLPGIYYLEKGIALHGNANLVANEVMIYNAGSGNAEDVNLGGDGTFSWTPPKSGPYQGISIWQGRNTDPNTTMSLRGNGGATVAGTFYAPTTKVLVTGSGTQTLGSQFIARTLEMAGSGHFTVDWTAPKAPQPPVLELVE